jgi:hypothetical protein
MQYEVIASLGMGEFDELIDRLLVTNESVF